MPITPTNISAGERQADWRNFNANSEVTPATTGASLVDPPKHDLIGNINPAQNQVLNTPNNKATDVRSTIDALSNLNAENLGSDSFSLLRLLHKCSLEQRSGARAVRQSEAFASKSAKLSAAQEIRESSRQRMIGAITAGAFQIGSAGVQAYSATRSLESIGSLKKAAPTNIPDPMDTTNAVSINDAVSQDIAAHVEPGNALLEQPLARTAGANTANAIAADHSKALVIHGEQNHAMAVVDSSASQRNVHIDNQDTLTVRDAKGNETLRVEIIDEAAEVASVPATAETPSGADAKVAADTEVAEPTDRELKLKELDFRAARLKAASEITQAAGNVINAVVQNSAARHDAQKAELEVTAATHDMAINQAGDEIQQTLERARSWREMLQGIDQSNTEANRGISRNI